MGVDKAAAAERLDTGEVERLLHDADFQALVAHYRELAGLTHEERLARLTSLALELLELYVAATDMRAVAFVYACTAKGLDPAREVALGVVRKLQRAADAQIGTRPDQPGRRPWLEARRFEPSRQPHAERDYGFCAGTHANATEAEALLEREMLRAAERINATRQHFIRGLMAEAERLGTVAAKPGRGCGQPTGGRGCGQPTGERGCGQPIGHPDEQARRQGRDDELAAPVRVRSPLLPASDEDDAALLAAIEAEGLRCTGTWVEGWHPPPPAVEPLAEPSDPHASPVDPHPCPPPRAAEPSRTPAVDKRPPAASPAASAEPRVNLWRSRGVDGRFDTS